MRVLVTLLILAAASAACSNNNNSNPGTSTPSTVTSVAVTGSAPAPGATAQFTATATFSNASTQNVTAQATWTSSNTAVATVNASGVVSGVAAGEADITATFQTVAGRVHVTIVRATTSTFTITGTVTDGTTGGILPNVNVQLTDSAEAVKTTQTGGAGTYSFSGVPAGNATVMVSATSYQTARTTVNVSADARVDITLQRVSCVFSLSTTSFSFGANGGAGTVTLSTQSTGCTWTARSNDTFITVTSGTSGVDTGTVVFSVAANASASPRTGTLTIANQTVTVVQSAGFGILTAQYDASFRAPACLDVGSGCDSGGLLNNSGTTETNQPNTIANACADGSGSGHLAIVDSIKLSVVNGGPMTAPANVLVEISLRLNAAAGRVRGYFAEDARNPVWVDLPLDFNPPQGQTITRVGTVFNTPGTHAIRVAFSGTGTAGSFSGSGPGACATGTDDDTDDIVFRVQ